MLLADFHVHTTWSDGKLDLEDVVDLFGQSGHDVIAITDHVVNDDCLLGKLAHRCRLSVTRDTAVRYLDALEEARRRAWDRWGMLLLSGFELTRNSATRDSSAHALALGVRDFISANGSVESMVARAKDHGAVVVAAHPHRMSDWYANTFYFWNRRREVLRPMSGLDDELEENLEALAALDPSRFEVILSVADPMDPAVAAAREVIRRNPRAPFRLVIGEGPRERVLNPKVERLIAATAHARGEILAIADSNVRITEEALLRTLEQFDDPAVGCVSNPFVGCGGRNAGAAIESLHLLSFVMPGNALAAACGVPCVVGKSMLLRRRALSTVGGLDAFANVLAEDQAIGLALADRGWKLRLAPHVVENVVVRRSLKQAMARMIRWNKIRFAFNPLLYAGELLANPLALALAAVPFSGDARSAVGLAAGIALLRVAQAGVLAATTGRRGWEGAALLAPAHDLVLLATWCVPFASRSVVWRGHRVQIGRGTVLRAATS